jgi:hypothetical protein
MYPESNQTYLERVNRILERVNRVLEAVVCLFLFVRFILNSVIGLFSLRWWQQLFSASSNLSGAEFY